MTRCLDLRFRAALTCSAALADKTMLSLRYPKLWLGFGWALLIAVTVGSLLPGVDRLNVDMHDKVMHFSSYFLLMIWFAGLYERTRHYFVIALILVALGIALDLMQGQMPYRQFDLLDIVANTAGVMSGFILALFAMGGWCLRIERWLLG